MYLYLLQPLQYQWINSIHIQKITNLTWLLTKNVRSTVILPLKKTMQVQYDVLICFVAPVRLRTSCLRWGSGTSGMGSSLKKSLRSEATVGTSCSCSRSTLSPLSHRCLSCLVLTTEPHRRNRPLCSIPVTRKQQD